MNKAGECRLRPGNQRRNVAGAGRLQLQTALDGAAMNGLNKTDHHPYTIEPRRSQISANDNPQASSHKRLTRPSNPQNTFSGLGHIARTDEKVNQIEYTNGSKSLVRNNSTLIPRPHAALWHTGLAATPSRNGAIAKTMERSPGFHTARDTSRQEE